MATTLYARIRELLGQRFGTRRRQIRNSDEAIAQEQLNKVINWQISDGLTVFRVFTRADMWRILQQDSLYPTFSYRHFTRPKKDNSLRDLFEPDPNLKQIQHQISRNFLHAAPTHRAVMAYRRKRSTVDHARAHAGANLIITADIEDFFPNTKMYRIEEWWRQYLRIFLDDSDADVDVAARLFTLLTTHKGSLPQGAPTSPLLSNVANYEMDAAIDRRIRLYGGHYTRYCDDLAFSWRLGEPSSDFEPAVRSVLAQHGYSLHHWKVYHAHEEPEITGIILKRSGEIDLPKAVKQKMRTLAGSSNVVDKVRLQGYQAYENMVKTKKRS